MLSNYFAWLTVTKKTNDLFHGTNVSMVKVEDRIKISEPKSLDFPSSLLDVLQVHITS